MYAKVFAQIFDSSIANNYELRHFFTDLLVLAECDGVVDMTPEAISARTRIPLELVLKFLEELSLPDPRSRSPEHDGRRIVLLDSHRDWGWQIVNYAVYRRIASDEQRREKTKNRVRKYRNTKTLETCNAPVTLGNACNAKQKQKQKQKQSAEAEVPPNPPSGELFPVQEKQFPKSISTDRVLNRWAAWKEHRKAYKKPKNWVGLFNEQIDWLSQFSEPDVFEILSQSIRNGWQGLFPLRKQPDTQQTYTDPSNYAFERDGNL